MCEKSDFPVFLYSKILFKQKEKYMSIWFITDSLIFAKFEDVM